MLNPVDSDSGHDGSLIMDQEKESFSIVVT